MSVESEIDWTGVAQPTEPIAPLDARTFVERLRQLSAEVAAMARLERAFAEQNPEYGHRLPERSPTAR